MSADPRLPEAERLLAERGIAGATVSPEGPEGEIAAIRLPSDALAAILDAGPELAGAVRALGFRYVAVDLG